MLANLGQLLPELSVLAVEALAVHPADIATAEALAVPGLTSGLEALALDLASVPVFVGRDGQHVEELSLVVGEGVEVVQFVAVHGDEEGVLEGGGLFLQLDGAEVIHPGGLLALGRGEGGQKFVMVILFYFYLGLFVL